MKLPEEVLDVIFHLEQVVEKIEAETVKVHGSHSDGLAHAADIVRQEIADLKEQHGY